MNFPSLRLGWVMMLLSCTIGCREQVKNIPVEGKKTAQKPAIIKKPPSSFNDTLVIDQKSAVFYTPIPCRWEKYRL